eukprot:gene5922-7373_t
MTSNYRQRWVQDLPPPGGFPKLNFARQSPKMVSGFTIFGVALAVSLFGHYKYFKTKLIQLENEKEERRRLTMILPILQAEADIIFLGSPHENVYYTRWMPPIANKHSSMIILKKD